jgi:hypothetical protein
MSTQVSNPLTLVLAIKSAQDFHTLKTLIGTMQSLPPAQNPIAIALTKIGTVHFARFVFLNQQQLAIITTYDDDFDRYIDSFVNAIGLVFDQLLIHIKDAPPLPVQQHPQEFKEFVRKHDLKCEGSLYSAYPEWKVQDLLTLINEHGET